MTIRYEANPPKILPDVNTEESIIKFVDKIKIISEKCDAIHITENVLGYERVSPIKIGKIINFIRSQNDCFFSRITGSGSACIGIFSNVKSAVLTKKLIKLKFPNYWCAVSKTI